MKKALIVFLLLPFIGFSQNAAVNSSELLVRWEGTKSNWNPSNSPMYYYNAASGTTTAPSAFAAPDVIGNNVNFNSSEQFGGFYTANWPNNSQAGNTLNYDNYVEFKLTAATGKKVLLKNFRFKYHFANANGGSYKIIYKKSSTGIPSNSSFSTGDVLATNVTASSNNNQDFSYAFPSGYNVLPGETIYLRIYVYQIDQYNNKWFINHDPLANDNGAASLNSDGPAFYGVVSNAGGVIANIDSATVTSGFAKTINVTSNDTATGTTIASVALTNTTLPTKGSRVLFGNNIVYTANAGITTATTDTFTYKITGADNSTSEATVTVNINPLVLPTATAESVTTVKNTAVNINVLSNDTYGSGTFSNIAVTAGPAHGATAVQPNNTITYTPATGYTGTDSFTYTFTNSENKSASATVSLNVTMPSAGTSPLSGTYAIGSGVQYNYSQFTTITAAVNHLNTYGVSGPVTFLLIDNATTKVYNTANGEVFPIVINTSASNPTSTTNTVTFKPAPGKNVKVEAPRPFVSSGPGNGDSWAVPAVFKLVGADNIIFDGSNTTGGTTRNMLLVNSSYAGALTRTVDADGNNNSNDYTDRTVIWLAPNGADDVKNITIKYVQIKQLYKNSSDNFCLGVYAGGGGVTDSNEVNVAEANGAVQNINITGNDLVNVKEGVFINGGTAYLSNNITVHDNDLGSETNTESVILPVSVNNVDTFTISQNYIYKLYRSTNSASLASGGINVTGASRNGNIFKNDLKDLKRPTENAQIFAGIVLASSYPNNNIKVYNNFILDVSAKGNGGGYSNGYGIVVDQGSGYRIYHNTVVLTPASNQPNGGFSAAFYVNENVTGLDVRNNIFVNRQTQTTTRRTAISVKNTSANVNSVFSFLDYNDYYSTDRLGYIAVSGNTGNITWPGNGIQGDFGDNADYSYTIGGWLTAVNSSVNGKEGHSKNVNPTFASATDLHVNGYSAANNGFVDAGTNAINAIVAKDIDGQIRKTDTPDMGADEFGPAAMPSPGSNAGIFCDSSTTWNGTAWSNGNPSSNKDVIFNADYTQIGGTLNACSMYVLDGKSVNFISESTAIVQHSVNVATSGALTFESSSHLIQVENDQNNGIVTVKRKGGKLKRLDYIMWSAPVTDGREGTTTVGNTTTTNYQSLLKFSPLTSTNRFYYYNNSTDDYQPYTPQSTKFTTGKSVLIRMPNETSVPSYNNGTTRMQFEGVFEGTPNTGTVRVPLEYTSAVKPFNGVGNPYPSPVNVSAFLQENAINSGVIAGTIWLWRKTNNSTISSYATVTLAGYAANSGGNNDGNDMIANPFSLATGGILNTGQGFIVQATAPNKELVWKNNMRQNIHTNAVFKTANNDDNNEVADFQGDRVWINVKGANEAFTQTLVGYSDATTLGFDNAYDGTALISGNIALYSVLPTEEETYKLAIQSRSQFNANDVVTMGYTATVGGTYEFEIDHSDGIFAAGQQVYVKDNLLGTTHNLNAGSYTFTTDAGTFTTRFEIVYQPQGQLGTDTPVTEAKDVIVYRDSKQIKVNSSQVISAVTVFDMLGRTLYNKSGVDNTEFATSEIEAAQQVVIVNVTLDNQQVISKKIMMN